MLAPSAAVPVSAGWAFEPKWDGFRAIVSTEQGLRVRSRRGWDMTALVPELAALPARGVFDGELVALNEHGEPHFPLVCRRLLHRDRRIPLAYVVFDVLELDGRRLSDLFYSERRAELDALALEGPAWHTCPSFDDGAALFQTVCERGLEGIVAKRLSGRYRPGEREWIKVKNRDYWRYGEELWAARAEPPPSVSAAFPAAGPRRAASAARASWDSARITPLVSSAKRRR